MRPKKKSELVGPGCLVQGIGLIAPFILYEYLGIEGLVVGIVLLLVLMQIGGRMAQKWVCPECKNTIASGDVRVCPSCRMEFE